MVVDADMFFLCFAFCNFVILKDKDYGLKTETYLMVDDMIGLQPCQTRSLLNDVLHLSSIVAFAQ